MNEQLLHYISHFTHIYVKSLSVSQYFPLSIYKEGKSNNHVEPDFLISRILYNNESYI